MRLRFAPAALAALLCLATPVTAPAFDREPAQNGDTITGNVLDPYSFNEYPIQLASGSLLYLTIAKVGGGAYQPALGLYTDDYSNESLVGVSASTARSAAPLLSRLYRVIVGGKSATVGAYKLAIAVAPQTTFTISGNTLSPNLVYGAYPGFDAAVTIKWKGTTPVTLKSVVGPDGATITSTQTPRTAKSSFSLAGFHASVLGDHTVAIDVPLGTKAWTITVKLTGKLPRGTKRDLRTTGLPAPPGIAFPSAGFLPIATIVGETGGPNDCLLSAQSTLPDAAFLDGGSGTGGCSRAVRDDANPATKYLLFCNNGFFVDVSNVVRYADGPWAGFVQSYEATSARSPQGSGSASLSDFTYDAQGRPTGWTEIRRFDASGRAHTLQFSGAAYFYNGYCKAFRVVHTPPDAPPRTYDYAPFR